ncbi:MAG: response regulator, partial [Spirochaetia bacterium]
YVPAAPDALEKVPGTEEGFEAGKGKILLMDDEDIVRKSVSRMLERLGYTVDLAFDGNEALNKYRKAIETDEKYDLVIMDLTIPGGMGGKEAIHLFHEIDPGVRAIVSSGYSNDPIMASCKDYGFCGVISKPFRLKDLSRVCKKILDQ